MENTSLIDGNIRRELKRFVYGKVRDNDAAEDIVQDTLIKILVKSDQLKDSDKARQWIYRITRNTIADYFRNKSKVLDETVTTDGGEGNPLTECAVSCITELMSTLPPAFREALEITEMENASQIDLAQRLNLSHSGAKSRVQRARQMLKERLDETCLIRTDGYGNVVVCESVTCESPKSCKSS